MQMFAMMLTALFTSRVVQDVLGAADYGLNNVISGVVVLVSYFNLRASLLKVQYVKCKSPLARMAVPI